MESPLASYDELDPRTLTFYCHVLTILTEAKLPFLVGGAYAFGRYTGIIRHTKDFDIFVRSDDLERTLGLLEKAGYATEVPFPHWLGKAHCGDDFIDIIYSSGNGVAPVDDEWFEHGVDGHVFDLPIKLCPPEEMIWQKAFIMERERYDGADVAHIVRALAERLDWQRLLRRFGNDNWRVLLSHLILFGYVYPGERSRIPAAVMTRLLSKVQRELGTDGRRSRLCRGPVISRAQYLTDVDLWGYRDARLEPVGNLSEEETELWTAAINGGK